MTETKETRSMETILRIVIFQVGTGYFGIDIRKIKEIVKVTNTPGASDNAPLTITERIHIHGNVVPILNLYEKFQAKQPVTGYTYIIVISSDHKLLALPGDRVDRYCDVPFQDLHPLPYLMQNTNTSYFQQVANVAGIPVLLLNLEWLFHEAGVN